MSVEEMLAAARGEATGGGADAAEEARQAVASGNFTVEAVESKPAKRNPPAPFTTSTLQQEAARKLGFNAARTMRVAQSLYEGVDIGGDIILVDHPH